MAAPVLPSSCARPWSVPVMQTWRARHGSSTASRARTAGCPALEVGLPVDASAAGGCLKCACSVLGGSGIGRICSRWALGGVLHTRGCLRYACSALGGSAL
eukprot:1157694-Pelagomonas_calceolata.AAC.19